MKMPKEWWQPIAGDHDGGIETSNNAPALIWGNDRSGYPNYRLAHIEKGEGIDTYCGKPGWWTPDHRVCSIHHKTVEDLELCSRCYHFRAAHQKEELKWGRGKEE